MIKLSILRIDLFGYNVLTLRFFELKIFTNTMDNNSAFLALQNIVGEPRANQLGTEITKIERF